MKTKINFLAAWVLLVGTGWWLQEAECRADGITWTDRSGNLTSYNLYAVAYGNHTFVAVGDVANAAFTSKDGVTWDVQATSAFSGLNSITYRNGTFVAVGYAGTILTSQDGKTWTDRSGATTNSLNGVTWGDGKFVAVGGDTDLNSYDPNTGLARSTSAILTSLDGTSWFTQESGIQRQLNAVAYGKGIFVAVGNYFVGPPSPLWTSPDGIAWTERNSGKSIPLWSVSYGNGRFVAVGRFGSGESELAGIILISTDGLTWTTIGNDLLGRQLPRLDGVGFGNGTFVAAGGGIAASTEGVIWTLSSRGGRGVGFGNGTFVIVGDGGTILQSQKLGPRLQLLPSLSTGPFEFNLLGEVGQSYQIEGSHDLFTWTAVTNLIPTDPVARFSDSQTSPMPKQFYRAVWP